jgi:hypothetical protein
MYETEFERWRRYSERIERGVPAFLAGAPFPLPSWETTKLAVGLAIAAGCLGGAAWLLLVG